jgi:serine O-acetyltransferase
MPMILERLREDVRAVKEKDPAARHTLEVLLTYPGLHAIWMHRVAHALWNHRLRLGARVLAHIVRRRTGVEIHPAARLGRRVVIDHGMGVVIGETAVVGDDVLIYQGVTLGGVKANGGRRHPLIGNHVMLGAHAALLGPITVGDHAKIGACVTLRQSVPAGTSVREEPVISMRPHGNPPRPASSYEV